MKDESAPREKREPYLSDYKEQNVTLPSYLYSAIDNKKAAHPCTLFAFQMRISEFQSEVDFHLSLHFQSYSRARHYAWVTLLFGLSIQLYVCRVLWIGGKPIE